MPLLLTEKHPDFGQFFLWSLTENKDYFRKILKTRRLEMDHINEWHPRRQLEWLAGRYLISEYLERDLSRLMIHREGKVSIENSKLELSISHCDELVGLQFAPKSIGLDIQIRTDQIDRVAHKFCSELDYEVLGQHFDDRESRLICWSMKEAVFKAYGLGKVDYKNDINFIAFANGNKRKPIMRFRSHEGITYKYNGRLRWIGDYCISQVVEAST